MFNASLPAALSLVVLLAQALPTQPPRDTRPAAPRTGTAAIRGRVSNPDTGAPVRRAAVTLTPVNMPTAAPPSGTVPPAGTVSGGPATLSMGGPPRTVRTDGSGQFEFTGLPAGAYRLQVSPNPNAGAYLPAIFGAKGARDPGRIIELKDGQEFNEAHIPLLRGGAVVGRIVDDNGDPLTRVMVYPSRVVPGANTFQRAGGGVIQSDDHGRYRIYGLEPGDYIVTAESRNMGGPVVEGAESEGFIATHHPSVIHQREAARIRVRAGMDLEGVDIQMIRTRTYKITGSIVDSQGAAPTGRINTQLVAPAGSGFSMNSGVSFDGQGRFTIRDVTPGEYTLVVRPALGEPAAPGGPPVQLRGEFASVPLSVSSDIENLLVVTQPGVTVSGTVVFADGGVLTEAASIRVSAQPGSRSLPMFGPMPSATVGADARFTLTNLHGPMLVRAGMPRRDWALQAIMLGATDITEMPVEFRKEHSGHLQIVISTRPAAIDGVVTGDDGAPAEQAMVVVFPEDKASWRFGSPRVRTTSSATGGKFAVTGLAAGRYYAAALPSRDYILSPDLPPEFFEGLTKDATRVVVAQDERRVVDLRVSKPPQ